MATIKQTESDQGPNRQAVEKLVAELEAQELRTPVLEPAIEIARSLASQVDFDGTSSQLWMRFQAAEADLRSKVAGVEDDRVRALNWSLNTFCDKHSQTDDAHCGICCRENDAFADLESFYFHPRSVYEGLADGRPVNPMTDEDYARASVLEFLRRKPVT